MTSTEDPGSTHDASAEERERRKRRAILDQLTAEAEELGLYDDPPPDYRAALKDARRRQSRGASTTE
ncbi:MAG: hypothetical protein ACRDZV_00515 [Acidimicrobiia bacterium]